MERRRNRRDKIAEEKKQAYLNPHHLRHQKRRRLRKRILIAAGILVFLVASVVISFQVVRAYGRQQLKENAYSAAAGSAGSGGANGEDGQQVTSSIHYQGNRYVLNEDIITFLVMGIDKLENVSEVSEGTEGGQADALFLLVLNPHKKSIQVIGVNRNTMTDIDIYNDMGNYVTTKTAQIAVQHGFGNGLEESCEYQRKAVSNLFYQLPINGYAAINMSAIPTINDAVDGVDVTVPVDLTKWDQTLTKGARVHLMGDAAYVFTSRRDVTIPGSADERLGRQKQYLTGFIKKAKQEIGGNVMTVKTIYDALQDSMVTDISLSEMLYLAPIVNGYDFDGDDILTLEGETRTGSDFEEFYVDEEALYRLILDVFYEQTDAVEN